MQQSLNWGLGAALGTILLFAVIVLYLLFNKIAGADAVCASDDGLAHPQMDDGVLRAGLP